MVMHSSRVLNQKLYALCQCQSWYLHNIILIISLYTAWCILKLHADLHVMDVSPEVNVSVKPLLIFTPSMVTNRCLPRVLPSDAGFMYVSLYLETKNLHV